MSAEIIKAVLAPFEGGKRAILLTGRPPDDLDIQGGEGHGGLKVRPILNIIARAARERHGMGCFTGSLGQGVRFDPEAGGLSRQEAETFLKQWKGLGGQDFGAASLNTSRGESALERVFAVLRSVYHLALAGAPDTLRALFFVGHGEDLVPEPAQTECSVQIAEILSDWANDPRLRAQRIVLVLHGIEERIDSRVRRSFTEVRLPQPNKGDKLRFLQVLRTSKVHAPASFDQDLTDDVIANLTLGTGNKGIEELFYESAKTGTPISCERLIAQKRADVVALSEGTIIPMDTARAKSVRLVGRTIEKAKRFLRQVAAGLRAGDPNTPANILLLGGPGTGKTDLISMTAIEAGVPVYSLVNPKGSLVGETERRARLQMRVFRELAPAWGDVDEVSEVFSMQRSQADLDGGANNSVLAEWLTSRSDRTARGSTVWSGTTNCPGRIATAVLDRCDVKFPVIRPCPEDYPGIVAEIAGSTDRAQKFDPSDPVLIEAASLFFEKGASPRTILSSITGLRIWTGEPLSPALVREAAILLSETDERDRLGVEYADLLALRLASSRLFFPWHEVPNFPFPAYLARVVDQDGSLNQENLSARLAELEGKVNV